MNSDDDFVRFKTLHTDISPSILWRNSDSLNSIKHALCTAKVLVEAKQSDVKTCKKCGSQTSDLNLHVISKCISLKKTRTTFLNSVEKQYSCELSNFLKGCNSETFLRTILNPRALDIYDIVEFLQKDFIQSACKFIYDCLVFNN
jgi:hypothetical protein